MKLFSDEANQPQFHPDFYARFQPDLQAIKWAASWVEKYKFMSMCAIVLCLPRKSPVAIQSKAFHSQYSHYSDQHYGLSVKTWGRPLWSQPHCEKGQQVLTKGPSSLNSASSSVHIQKSRKLASLASSRKKLEQLDKWSFPCDITRFFFLSFFEKETLQTI